MHVQTQPVTQTMSKVSTETRLLDNIAGNSVDVLGNRSGTNRLDALPLCFEHQPEHETEAGAGFAPGDLSEATDEGGQLPPGRRPGRDHTLS